jgi:hypothetical protein
MLAPLKPHEYRTRHDVHGALVSPPRGNPPLLPITPFTPRVDRPTGYQVAFCGIPVQAPGLLHQVQQALGYGGHLHVRRSMTTRLAERNDGAAGEGDEEGGAGGGVDSGHG